MPDSEPAKDEVIVLRVTSEDKQVIQEAASRRGQSVTTFLTSAALRAAKKGREESKMLETKRPKSGPCPAYFRCAVIEAQRGGALGYDRASYELARHLPKEQPWDVEDEEWERRITEDLGPVVQEEDEEGIWRWFQTNLPRCTALVPARRRGRFVLGVLQAAEDGILEF